MERFDKITVIQSLIMEAGAMTEIFSWVLTNYRDLAFDLRNSDEFSHTAADVADLAERLKKSPVSVREFCARMAFEQCFVDLEPVAEYGFDTWAELYDHVRYKGLDDLIALNGKGTELVEEFTGAYLPTLLETKFYDNKYLVGELLRGNVDFSTYKE